MLYLSPWREEWANWIEFRCFCYRKRITAFSQYVWCRDLGLSTWTPEQLAQCATNIVRFCEEEVSAKLSDKTGGHWVIDVILSKEVLAPQFVEVNPFGAELSSGSALFNWVRDKEILYGDGSVVVFRLVGYGGTRYALCGFFFFLSSFFFIHIAFTADNSFAYPLVGRQGSPSA